MNRIEVGTSSPYAVLVDKGLIRQTGAYLRQVLPGAETAMIITDDTVAGLYGSQTEESVRKAGLQVRTFTIPHGEASKNAENYLQILNALGEAHLTRSDVIIALGGGVVGDLAGFAAATYLRGIPFIQIPTTLLAQVDSSVGGKTAIDIPAGKNLAGAFYQPALVLCDPDTLSTLPADIFRDGCAEVIKYGILWDRALFEHLKTNGLAFDRTYTVVRCIEMKRDVVVTDEFDRGQRQLLNLGHTLAHAEEKVSGYRISHGRAVAMGMAVMARAAAAAGRCSPACASEIQHLIEAFGLPVTSNYSLDELYGAMTSDKKRSGNMISLILPEDIGRCVIHRCPLQEMKALIAPGMRL